MAEEKFVPIALPGKFIVRKISGNSDKSTTGMNKGRKKSETNGVEVKKTNGTAKMFGVMQSSKNPCK